MTAMRLVGNGLAKRISRANLQQVRRGGGGGPVAYRKAPAEPLAEGDELTWDDGTVYPEPCLDQYEFMGKEKALGMLLAGLGGFAALGYALTVRDKASMKPFVNRKVMAQELNDLP
ncbi:hypothetical protein HKI87_04g28710 [Chloropicon roscoffensis]|uniref:Uncharacterized protein n=1 Tax=Chloropicon roscoffensis TaxID=1461544 RepID=A0AAX4P678_9CHLO